MREQITEEMIETLETDLRNVTEQATDEEISRIMFKVLLFAMQVPKLNENIINNYSWKYFEKNKEYFTQRVP